MMNQAEATGGVNTSRPPSYLVRAIVLSLVLVPLGLLVAASKLLETLNILYRPLYRSEIPAWMKALMAMMAGFAAILGIFPPMIALFNSLEVNSRFAAGDYLGAEKASKRAASYCKQSIIFLFILMVLIFTDILRYLVSNS